MLDEDEVLDGAQRYEFATQTYIGMSARARKAKVHPGPVQLRAAKKPPKRLQWVEQDRQFHPYCYMDNANHKPAPLPKRPTEPPKLWFVKTKADLEREENEARKAEARAQKKAIEKAREEEMGKDDEEEDDEVIPARGAKVKAEVQAKAQAKGSPSIEDKRPWDTEHHILVSQANSEVQVYVREYFDKPIRKEGEGVPKVRELYSMNDRQCGWSDEPNDAIGFRRTHLDWVGAHNVGGSKEQQMPSYWRNAAKRKMANQSAPNLNITIDGKIKAPLDQSLLERLAQMPAAQSSEFWRGWAQQPRKPAAIVEQSHSKRKGGVATALASSAPTLIVVEGASAASQAPKQRPWNDRWSITHSKDNEHMTKGHCQYFTSAQYLSGAELGHPGAFLGLPSVQWRNVAEKVSHFPVGVDGRGPAGRSTMLV